MRYSEVDVVEFQRIVAKESPGDAGNCIWNVRHAYDGGCKFSSWKRSQYGHLNTFRTERGLPLVPLKGGESGFLKIQDGGFVTERGEPWIFGGYTHFDAPALRIMHGVSIRDLLVEPIKYGANTVVWFGMRQRANGEKFDPFKLPNYRDDLSRAFDEAAAEEMRVLFRVIVDRRTLGWSDQQCVDLWGLCCEIMRGRWNVIACLGNELIAESAPDQNIFMLPDLKGVLASRGTNGGERLPPRPFWDIAEWEPPREIPKALYEASVGLMQMREGNVGSDWGGPIPDHVALINSEPLGFHEFSTPSRSSDPAVARALGVASAYATQRKCSGATFHTTFGQTCEPLGPNTAQCAYAFYNGLYAGFVR